MKKIWLVIICAVIAAGAFFVWSNSSTPAKSDSAGSSVNVESGFKDGKQFSTLKRNATEAPQVLEFFSFFCPHCYDFENVYHMSDEFKKQLPENGKLVKYHVDFMGGELGSQLTQAWAVAITLGVQDKVAPLIFSGIQKTQTIRNLDGIRQAFIEAGVTGEEFDSAWNSFIVKSLTAQQRKMAADVELRSVPSVLVNGKYMVKNDGLEANSVESFIQEYGQVVKYLLGQK
ncbi:thiol:disulfide interchange protein DsbA [Pragia fontium]|uniref:Thiol:disulfide interchange protein n=2 Tax=Pragia fontium TaxID=82985 RepID=A0AAJ4WCF2_9GAMM|nr:thiol:disulfide interchange protein DsbA [Pragia fontium]GKX64311.1 thiol:disulfide interchange protein [Pragia fontium]SFD20523.1 thiol:disulfide interchange protein DsbA [Pragia fontium DSM 5563 = ATCC 49100]SUB84107.1 Thiol:disulfide interchange protein DsbA precursor [Pragia fontium]VEJ56999.1 Thiol:disulfide interchange protein DsbA precursor [Pragia fontium]